ncbi:MAG: VOC family protein [Ahrensia sp.]|nr:VOC family protein [Ahrensia sp.]
MIKQIRGLHHVTSLASNARDNNAFFTDVLGLRRIKKTVNFDQPNVYHLYYGDEGGTPGTVMTYFPFPGMHKGAPGTGEVGSTRFAVPKGSLSFWRQRFEDKGMAGSEMNNAFGEQSIAFQGPDDDGFELIEVADDGRVGWTGNGVGEQAAIHGFHSASMRLRDAEATGELLSFMGYEQIDKAGNTTRYAVAGGNEANIIDIETLPSADHADQGAGSVHHIAFAVEDRAAQLEVRKALMDTGYQVTPVIDRDYFWAIYFRTPGGVLFEVATNEPGFDRDEDTAHLGEALKLPTQHEHLRERLEETLQPL